MSGCAPSATPRRLIDTNIMLRYLVGDGGEQAIKARGLFQDASDGKVILVIPEVVLVECVHVLRSYYRVDRADIAKALRGVIRLPGVETMTPAPVLTRSLDFFASVNVPWPDALIAAHALEQTAPEIYSFDGHFDKFDGVRKLTP